MECKVKITGFVGGIFSLAIVNDRLFAGCQDTTIKVPLFPPTTL